MAIPQKILCGGNCTILSILYASMKLKKIMAKYTNTLEFFGILQFSQTHLRLEINFSKEIKKMIAKYFHSTLMWSFHFIFSIMIAFKPLCNHFLSTVMLFAIFCNHAIILLSLRSPWFPSLDYAKTVFFLLTKAHNRINIFSRSIIWCWAQETLNL